MFFILYRLSTDTLDMDFTTRAAMGEPRPSEEVGYLIYCPTVEELEDRCMEEDFKADIRCELGDDFMKDANLDKQKVAQSMYQGNNLLLDVQQGRIPYFAPKKGAMQTNS